MKRVIFASVLLLAALSIFPLKDGESIYKNTLRVRFIANSDSPEDQELKMNVRAAILDLSEEILENVDSAGEAFAAVEENLDSFARVGNNIIKNEGYNYPITVSLGESYYPRREYEDFELPAGRYNGLVVNIGEGKGENFWCVLFPGLCSSLSEFESNKKIDDRLVKKEKNSIDKYRFWVVESVSKVSTLFRKNI